MLFESVTKICMFTTHIIWVHVGIDMGNKTAEAENENSQGW